ncbi:MAG TPA: ComEC/Rec2 family competence protein [Pseudolysinimonas sp.]|nr:ComEC/Rec2 family competence protein [Pseudolysinimonas sp.]
MKDLRLVPAAVCAWASAGVIVGAPHMAGATAAVLAVLVALALAVARRVRWAPAIAVALAASAVVAVAVIAHASAREPPALVAAEQTGRTVELRVAVTGHPSQGHVRATAGSAPVLVFGEVDGVRIGDELTLRARVQRVDAGEDVAFLVFARADIAVSSPAGGALAVANDLRSSFAAVAGELPGRGAGLLPGLAIGDTSAVAPQLDADMKTSSLSHLTAVSGSNCALVVGLVFAACAGLGMPRWVRLIVSGAALVGFVVLVTPEPSVVRAAAMAVIALAALGLSRPARGVPLLCAAVIVLLVGDPWLARSYGFALSVLATGGLLVLAAPLARALGRWLPRGVALLIAVPLAAQLACQPVLLLLDPSLPLYGVLANLLAEPAAPLATVAGLAACLVAPVLPGVAGALTWVAWVPASWIAAVAGFTAGLPGARSPWPTGPVGVAAMIVITAAVVAMLMGLGRPTVRLLVRGALVVALLAYGGSIAGGRIAEQASRPADWEFAQCDVGQGDAVIIRSAGEIAVIDVGPQPARLSACLDDLGIGRIQLLVLTHYDLDHVGGVDAVLGRVDRALIGPASDPGDVRIASALRAGGARVDEVSRGETGRLGALDWRVVWPPPSGVEPGNPASVTLLVTPSPGCPCLSGIFLGDLGQESQMRLLGSAALPHVDVVKVAHHGSADQEPELYEKLRATVGLIGVGADNDYGHPTQQLLGVLHAVATRPLRSDLDGLVLVAPGPDATVRVWSQRGNASGPSAAATSLYGTRGHRWRHRRGAARRARSPSRS